MANKTIANVQAKLDELALVLPRLQENEQWIEVLREMEGLSQNTNRQELLLETVTAISDAASSILEVDDLLRLSVNLIRDYFVFYYVGIFLTDESNEWAVFRAGTGESSQLLREKRHHLKIGGETLVGWSIYHCQPRIALDIGPEAVHFQDPLLPKTRSEIVLPLINRGQVIGALDLQSSEPVAFSEDDITLFQTLADQLANTIQNAQLFTENTRLLNQAENNRRFLKAVIEHIPDPIFIKDKNHALLEMNQANARVIGQSEQELLGKTDRDFLPVELAEKFYQRDNEVFTTNQILVAEDKTVWGDGQEHTAYTRLIPIPNSAGQPEYLLGITQDVTESRAQEAERERLLTETAALYKGSRTIASALSERQIFEALFEQIRLFDPCEISAFRFDLVDNEPTWVELRVNWHAERRNNPSYPVGSRFYLPETPQTKLLSTTEPLFIDEIATDHRLAEVERASFAPVGAHSVAILPLAATGQQLGAIMVNFTNPFTFTEEIQRLWLAIADQVRVALANRQLIEEATYRAVRMETAAEVARAASSILDLQELLNSAVALICDRFDLYYVGAFLVDETKEWAVLRAGTDEAGRIQLQKQHRLKIGGESMIGWSIYHRQPRIALDVGKEAVRFQNPDLPETRSEIALPLIYHQEAMGALTVQSAEQAAFRREDIVFLQTMADQLANAVVNARLYEQAQQEIIERNRSEEALRASEALYQSLVDNIPQNIFRKDRESRFVFGNKSFCNSLAISLDELVGKTDFDFYPVELAEKYRQDDQKVLETGEIFEIAEEHQAVTGENIYVRVVKSPIYDFNGEITGTQGIFWDITERKKAEEALRESEQRLELVLRGANLGSWDLNVQTGVDTVDQRAAKMLGFTLDEIEPQVRWWDNRTHPDDLPGATEIFEAHLRGEAPFYECEYRLLTKSGEWKWILDRGKIVERDQYGKPLRLTGTHLDITERKQAEEALRANEERYRTIFEQSSDMIYIMAHEGEFLAVNQAGLGLFGYSSQEMIGLNMQEICIDPVDWLKLAQQIEQKGSVKDYEIKLRKKNDLPMDCLLNTVLWQDPNGNIIGYQGVIRDMTERKQAEEALAEAFKRTQLLYNISEALATLINQQAAFETVLGEYLLLLNVSRGGIMLLDPAGETNTLQALYIDNKVVEPNLVFPAKEDLLAQYLQQNPFPLVIEDVSTHALTQHNQAIRSHVESMLVIPVVTRGEVVGIIGADATEKGHIFTRDDIEIGKAIADQLAIWLENHQLLDEAQYRSERLQTVAEISRAASSLLDVNELINTSVNLIRDQFDFYYVGLFMVDGAREWAILRAGTGEAGRVQLAREHQLKIGGESMIGWCIQNRQARIALDVGQEAVRFQNPFLPDTHSEMALPLISRDEVIGALTVQSIERGAFSAEDITLLQTMADQLANAIENARLFESVTQAQREAEDLLKDTQALQQFSQTLAGTLEVNQILDMFFEACAKVMGFEYAQFSLVDKYQNRIKAIAGFGVTESNLKHANQSLDSKDILVDIVKTGQTEIITGWDERFDREIFEAEGHGNWVRVFTPITLRQENIGLVEVGFNKNTKQIIQESQIRLLRAFIDQTALALDNAQRYEASQRAARREALIKEITTKVRASTNVDTILQTTVKEVGDALGSKRAYVHLVSPTNGEAK